MEALNLYNLLQKTEQEGMLHTSFYKTGITLIQKPDKTVLKRKVQKITQTQKPQTKYQLMKYTNALKIIP